MKGKYDTHVQPNFEIILGYLRSGFTEASIAKRLGVGVSTWEKYKNEHVEFLELIKTGRQDVAALAVNSLVKRATGYDYEEIHTEIKISGKAQSEQGQRVSQPAVIKKITKHVMPDVGAICVILFNRMKTKWQNKQEIRHSGQIKNAGVLLAGAPLSKEAWLQFYKDNVENTDKDSADEPT